MLVSPIAPEVSTCPPSVHEVIRNCVEHCRGNECYPLAITSRFPFLSTQCFCACPDLGDAELEASR